ncbi:MAG TPA: hypothetical protein VLA54_10645, partial [Acidimicrobiia bacterium]|nr:hypothetical protein [Acidimicrobiia bacterium]
MRPSLCAALVLLAACSSGGEPVPTSAVPTTPSSTAGTSTIPPGTTTTRETTTAPLTTTTMRPLAGLTYTAVTGGLPFPV